MNPFTSNENRRLADEVLAKYDAMAKPNDPIIGEVTSRINALREKAPTFTTVLEMELLRLNCVDQEQLALEVAELRLGWKRFSTTSMDSRDPRALGREELLGEAVVLTSNIFHQYGAREDFARAKRAIVLWMLVALLLFSLAAGAILKAMSLNVIAMELFLGALGGYVSTFIRMYQYPLGDDPALSARLLRSDWASIVARPILGAVFAVMLHLLFVSRLLTGGIFPDLRVVGSAPSMPARSFGEFFVGQLQGAGADPSYEYAKLLVWCFIAGFAERFVPDFLDRLSKESPMAAKNEAR